MITFRNDDEKHAWDLYVAGALACPGLVESKYLEAADTILAGRREREPQPSTEPRPRPGPGVDRA